MYYTATLDRSNSHFNALYAHYGMPTLAPTTALLVWTLNKAMVGFTAKSVAERVETPGLRCTQPNKRSAYIDMKQYSCFICVHFRTHALCIRKHA